MNTRFCDCATFRERIEMAEDAGTAIVQAHDACTIIAHCALPCNIQLMTLSLGDTVFRFVTTSSATESKRHNRYVRYTGSIVIGFETQSSLSHNKASESVHWLTALCHLLPRTPSFWPQLDHSHD